MPLPAGYADPNETSGSDIIYRFVKGYVDYNDRPFFIRTLRGNNDIFKMYRTRLGLDLKLHMTSEEVPLHDQALSIKGLGSRLGYINFTPDTVMYVTRVPLRARKQSLCGKNTIVGIYQAGKGFSLVRSAVNTPSKLSYLELSSIPIMLDKPNAVNQLIETAGSYGMNWELMIALSAPGIDETYSNKFKSFNETLDTLGNKQVKAISRKHLLERDEFGDMYLISDYHKVGKIMKDRVRYLPDKVYLSGDVERTTGLKPV